MANFDLWVDWDDEGESAGWQSKCKIDLERFQTDNRYANVVSDYITRALDYLAREIEEIGLQMPRGGLEEDNCE